MKRYVLFNKPYGVITQFHDASGRHRTLKEFISIPDVYPTGRLDRDSEGLVLLTDDGWMQHRLSDPKYEHPRVYWVQVEGLPNADALRNLSGGVTIWEYQTKPTATRIIEEPKLWPRDPPVRFRKNVPTSWLEMTLTEGKNRQVRRMTAAVGHPTLRLVRASIGNFRLGEMQPGDWRELDHDERTQLFRECGVDRKPGNRHQRV